MTVTCYPKISDRTMAADYQQISFLLKVKLLPKDRSDVPVPDLKYHPYYRNIVEELNIMRIKERESKMRLRDRDKNKGTVYSKERSVSRFKKLYLSQNHSSACNLFASSISYPTPIIPLANVTLLTNDVVTHPAVVTFDKPSEGNQDKFLEVGQNIRGRKPGPKSRVTKHYVQCEPKKNVLDISSSLQDTISVISVVDVEADVSSCDKSESFVVSSSYCLRSSKDTSPVVETTSTTTQKVESAPVVALVDVTKQPQYGNLVKSLIVSSASETSTPAASDPCLSGSKQHVSKVSTINLPRSSKPLPVETRMTRSKFLAKILQMHPEKQGASSHNPHPHIRAVSTEAADETANSAVTATTTGIAERSSLPLKGEEKNLYSGHIVCKDKTPSRKRHNGQLTPVKAVVVQLKDCTKPPPAKDACLAVNTSQACTGVLSPYNNNETPSDHSFQDEQELYYAVVEPYTVQGYHADIVAKEGAWVANSVQGGATGQRHSNNNAHLPYPESRAHCTGQPVHCATITTKYVSQEQTTCPNTVPAIRLRKITPVRGSPITDLGSVTTKNRQTECKGLGRSNFAPGAKVHRHGKHKKCDSISDQRIRHSVDSMVNSESEDEHYISVETDSLVHKYLRALSDRTAVVGSTHKHTHHAKKDQKTANPSASKDTQNELLIRNRIEGGFEQIHRGLAEEQFGSIKSSAVVKSNHCTSLPPISSTSATRMHHRKQTSHREFSGQKTVELITLSDSEEECNSDIQCLGPASTQRNGIQRVYMKHFPPGLGGTREQPANSMKTNSSPQDSRGQLDSSQLKKRRTDANRIAAGPQNSPTFDRKQRKRNLEKENRRGVELVDMSEDVSSPTTKTSLTGRFTAHDLYEKNKADKVLNTLSSVLPNFVELPRLCVSDYDTYGEDKDVMIIE